MKLGAEIMRRDPEGRSQKVFEERWRSFFCVKPSVCVTAWTLIGVPVHPTDDDADLSHARPEHLLWALLFLKVYGDEHESSGLAGGDNGAVDEKTFRKWVEIFVSRIACLADQVVSTFMLRHYCSTRRAKTNT